MILEEAIKNISKAFNNPQAEVEFFDDESGCVFIDRWLLGSDVKPPEDDEILFEFHKIQRFYR